MPGRRSTVSCLRIAKKFSTSIRQRQCAESCQLAPSRATRFGTGWRRCRGDQGNVIDVPSGQVAYAVLSFGGFLGIGQKLFAIPWAALTLDEDRKCFMLDVDKSTLEK